MPIVWPDEFDPAQAPVHVRNEIDISAPCDRVWAWLIRAQLWPTWYSNSADVQFLSGTPPDLDAGTQFRWSTFGVTLDSTVLEFVPPSRIAWDARRAGIQAYHAWLLEPASGRCHVITEETQHGILARAGKLLTPNRMSRGHDEWLEGLRDNAMHGLPPL
ncbi:MAG TPA: SRPBCC domain-containing protein [Thermoanaerobaculia bacterium]|nr:SRPBCC domain-containing protein [Thermoanaerobaculia bacterium]